MTNLNPQKQWWAPVWTGLVIDSDAKHYRHMKNAVWLYLYFLLHANRRTGLLKRKLQTICSDMGVSRDTAIRWLGVLRTKGYIATSNSGRALTIQITRWKPIVGLPKTRDIPGDILLFWSSKIRMSPLCPGGIRCVDGNSRRRQLRRHR